jgi:hypothetical protein
MTPWHELRDAWEAAYLAENELQREAYRQAGITPKMEALPQGPKRTAWVNRLPAWYWEKGQEIEDTRYAIEDDLMPYPAPDLAAFAFKFLVAFGDDRDANHWTETLEADARRLLAQPAPDACWEAADAEVRRLDAAVTAVSDDAEGDRLSHELTSATHALIALKPTTVRQAVRRIELGLRGGPLSDIDPDALIDDAVKLTEASPC